MNEFKFVCHTCGLKFTEEESLGEYTYKCPHCVTDCSDQIPIQPEGMCEGWTWQDVENQMTL